MYVYIVYVYCWPFYILLLANILEQQFLSLDLVEDQAIAMLSMDTFCGGVGGGVVVSVGVGVGVGVEWVWCGVVWM